MRNKFKNKYRISSARLQSWDYSNNGAYFITICTQNRNHFFGKIQNQEMHLSEIGKLAEKYWLEIPEYFPFVEVGSFVVMPNHFHGILIINKLNIDSTVETRFIASVNNDGVDDQNKTRLIVSLPGKMGGFSADNNPMLTDSISKIIRWYKGRCSFECRKLNPNFGWQSRFHDHIIRNANAFVNIQNYIANNPAKWKEDTFWKE